MEAPRPASSFKENNIKAYMAVVEIVNTCSQPSQLREVGNVDKLQKVIIDYAATPADVAEMAAELMVQKVHGIETNVTDTIPYSDEWRKLKGNLLSILTQS